MKHEIIEKLATQGYKVKPNGEIYKYSNSTKSNKKLGQVNENNVYFYGTVPYPYKKNPTFFDEILEAEVKYTPFIPKIYKESVEHQFTIEQYITATKEKNQFQLYINKFDDEENPYNTRGVKSGALEDATLFPYINFNGEFITAKIVKYNSNSGKRVKVGYANNWFHAYPQIKDELGLDSDVKISKKVNCFFGEHLVADNERPIVIVEAEKTAILLSLLYKEIVFIASGGLGKLKTLDTAFLDDRNVFVFPDNGATEWFDICSKRKWWCSTLLEDKGSDKNDVIDYLDTELGDEINAQLRGIADREIEYQVDNSELDFRVKKKTRYDYCIPNFRTLLLNNYWDNADDLNPNSVAWNGENFKMFDMPFQVLNANVDFNRWRYKDNKSYQVDATEFVKRLEKSFRIMKHLNPTVNSVAMFSEVLVHLLENSNFTFNRNYILNNLVSEWDADDNNLDVYLKRRRNWRVKNARTIERDEFLRLLSNDLNAFKTSKYLHKIQPLLSKRKFIDVKVIGLEKKQSPLVWNLIKRYNSEVLGCTTKYNYEQKIILNDYFNFIDEKTSELDESIELYQKFDIPYYSTNIVCQESDTIFKLPSVQVINDNTFVYKRIIKEFLNFKPNEDVLLDIKVIVQYLIENPLRLEYKRVKSRIEVEASDDKETMVNYIVDSFNDVVEVELKEDYELTPKRYDISTKEAFDYDLDLSGSVLACDEETAIQKGGVFLYSWIKFNLNKELTQYEDSLAKYTPLEFINSDAFKLAS